MGTVLLRAVPLIVISSVTKNVFYFARAAIQTIASHDLKYVCISHSKIPVLKLMTICEVQNNSFSFVIVMEATNGVLILTMCRPASMHIHGC
jgi:hypothetical protein